MANVDIKAEYEILVKRQVQIETENENLRQQRDNLLAACKLWAKFIDTCGGKVELPLPDALILQNVVRQNKAAIDKAKGE